MNNSQVLTFFEVLLETVVWKRLSLSSIIVKQCTNKCCLWTIIPADCNII